MIGKLKNVAVYPGSEMTADDIAGFGAEHVVLATGSAWRRDGVGVNGMEVLELPAALTPDDVFAGATLSGNIVIYDDEHYFMGGALAEKLAREGHSVTLVTPNASVSSWTAMTDEIGFLHERLHGLGLAMHTGRMLLGRGKGHITLACSASGKESELPCDTLILATGRLPQDRLYHELAADAQPFTLHRVGDCLQPSSIADAVYSAHRFAREFGEEAVAVPRRERPPVKDIA
jgi:dimethylamine/trimethylamine dehydrogenase